MVRLGSMRDCDWYAQFSNSNNASFCLAPNEERDSRLLMLMAGCAVRCAADESEVDKESGERTEKHEQQVVTC